MNPQRYLTDVPYISTLDSIDQLFIIQNQLLIRAGWSRTRTENTRLQTNWFQRTLSFHKCELIMHLYCSTDKPLYDCHVLCHFIILVNERYIWTGYIVNPVPSLNQLNSMNLIPVRAKRLRVYSSLRLLLENGNQLFMCCAYQFVVCLLSDKTLENETT